MATSPRKTTARNKAVGTIVDLGPRGYEFALANAVARLKG